MMAMSRNVALSATGALQTAKRLVFIDADLEHPEILADGVRNGLEAIILDRHQDGIAQIGAMLSHYSSLGAKIAQVHILSHGSPGCLYLGSGVVNSDTLKSDRLHGWRKALSETATLFVYGCRVAAETGTNFINQLAEITGATVAASGEIVGAGYWHLEYSTATVELSLPLTEKAIASYRGTFGTITVTNNNDSGPGSLREAIANASDGYTITFDSSLSSQTINLSQELVINKSITVDGESASGLTLSGGGNTRVIDIQISPDFIPPSVTLQNLIIADGLATGEGEDGAGGGIRMASRTSLTLENSQVNNNRAEFAGGILTGFRSNTTIINSQFDGNDGTAGGSERGGGAIATKSAGTLTVIDSTFTNNKGINGGAINHLLGDLTVEGSTFRNNDSTPGDLGGDPSGYGGAIFTDGANASGENFGPGPVGGEIRISNSLIEDNKGAGQGGGLFLYAYPPDRVIIENSQIINNEVVESSRGQALGGGLRHGNAELTINNTTFANNRSENQGGGLWIGETSPVTITNTTISGNRAESADGSGLGGGITFANGTNPTNITNTTIANNYAGGQGGGFWGGGDNVTLTNTISAYNVANNRGNDWNINHHTGTTYNDGGGNIQSNELNPNDTLITSNVTLADPLLGDLQEINGVLIHPLLPGSPAIDGGITVNTITTDQRGATRPVDGDNSGTAEFDVGAYEMIPTIDEPSLIVTNNNDAGEGSLREAIANAASGDTITFAAELTGGNTITLTGGQLEIPVGKNLIIDGGNNANLTISGNNISRVFYLNSTSANPTSLTIQNLTIANGYTPERGGGIATTHQGILTVENVTFNDNVADQGGGAIFSAFEGRLTVNESDFNRNKAIAGNDERGAGAIAFRGPNEIIVTDSDFIGNEGINGAAINSLNGRLTVENSRFINNSTTAAFYDTGNDNPSLRGYGGAIYTDRASTSSNDTSGTITIRNSLFEGNSGRGEGGAAYLYTGTQDNVIVESSVFKDNEILPLPGGNGGNGGAIVQMNNGLNQGFEVINTAFVNNTAANQGGGIWMMNAPTVITNTTFSGNRAESLTTSGNGGAMALYGPADIINTTIAENYAGWVGGGIVASADQTVTVRNTIFYKNTADNGTNNWGIQQHTNRELVDGGGNIQWLEKLTNLANDYNATATIAIADPLLGPLQHQNETYFYPLLEGSPAIDGGVNVGISTDQRGEPRPIDGDGNGTDTFTRHFSGCSRTMQR
ncbi:MULTISPECIES: DUF4347 domain-containing protein [Limnospira]|uniref:DUF4347 domain-containing protein n=1 Tax=Limnospira TaxID=2596745 RepID=UPI0002803E64|nr:MULTISPECIES: DUF4347 domain-containing protein [unclassified Limnospira]EKD06057.1 hypothetical protein SPLC1_S540020 [Arthrospira platensis C1]MDT9235591.1 DUF4347 domain-containing protein [Limnospira sp. PMC 917.15]MDT9276449.1 DUF4347 domain-containing protein [Limnospira sp. PMC 737.11]MDY7055396.1 DUF4347 domain-containing protein [Limnospira fusiformis LS22]